MCVRSGCVRNKGESPSRDRVGQCARVGSSRVNRAAEYTRLSAIRKGVNAALSVFGVDQVRLESR